MNTVLTVDEIRKAAPSVFATTPHHTTSSRYAFTPTSEVIEILREGNFYPVKAAQSRCHTSDKKEFTKHILRFRHDSYLNTQSVGDEIPEIVLVNSHDRSSAYNLMAGIFRLVCSNGMIVQSTNMGSISIRHSGPKDFRERVIDATYRIVDETPTIMRGIETWKGIELTRPQQLAMASAALELKPSAHIDPDKLLTPRRVADDKENLWTVSNVIQENLIKGGIRGKVTNGRRTTTRAIKAVSADVATNRALWRLTEEMAKLVG